MNDDRKGPTVMPVLELLTCIDIPGIASQVPLVRTELRARLGETHPAAVDDAELGVTELIGNALRHTRSGRGGCVHVEVLASAETVRVEVTDDGATRGTAPRVSTPGFEAESGRGLWTLEAITSRWGYEPAASGTMVWFEIDVKTTAAPSTGNGWPGGGSCESGGRSPAGSPDSQL